ncbi:MAG TPA: HAMP domain-containing sensor histidine kinase [Bacillota bacterium]|nr:HAMP domain-containing sensor histidine kinase [Bacillota bacterium]
MRNRPLAVQIWFVFAGIMVGLSILLILIVPFVLRPFFTQEIYTRIEDAQNIRWEALQESPAQAVPDNRRQVTIRSVRHLLTKGDTPFHSANQLPSEFLTEATSQALAQTEGIKQYKKVIGEQTIYYAIRKGEIGGQKAFLLSYITGNYPKTQVESVVRQIAIVIAIVLLVSWPPSILLAKYLSRSLVNMEKQVKRIENREWDEPLIMDRKDEIGRLGQSIEHMRQRLVQMDANQRSFLQNISHELKTPIMVIQSYTQSIQDGIFPKGNLTESVKVIEEESERLKKLVQQLLYMTKLDYLSTREQLQHESIEIVPLIQSSIDRLRFQRPDIYWIVDFHGGTVKGESEQLRVAIENILDNQMRYANQQIKVSVRETRNEEKGSLVIIQFQNDGVPLDPEILQNLFQPFKKGVKGQFGLGLTIAKRIVELYKGRVWAENEENGVSFYFEFPTT